MENKLREFKAEIFQALAHPTRVAIIEALSGGEQAMGDLIARLGLEQANASQHMAVLRAKHVVVSRKAGNQVYYSLQNPALVEVLAALKRYFYAHLDNSESLLARMREEAGASK